MLRTIIFDFNGIVVDDEPIHLELFQKVLREEGISLDDETYYRRYLGMDDKGCFSAVYRDQAAQLNDRLLEKLIRRKAVYYQDCIQNRMRVFPGVQDLVRSLADRFPLAIASGALKNEIETILASIHLREFFRAIVSAEDVAQGKPNPEIFLLALNRINQFLCGEIPIRPSECLVIEDSKEGIAGARAAGMKCLAITNSHPANELGEASAVRESLAEVSVSFLETLCD